MDRPPPEGFDWQALRALSQTLDLPSDASIRRQDPLPSSVAAVGSDPGAPRPDSGVELLEPIGRGGMGVVRTGRQRSLRREIAVKEPREERRDPSATRKFLQEAWVTGALEHPNIVPVHDILVGEDGEPLILMKRIQGEAWSELIHAPDTVRERFGESDPLEWNLRVLMQACQALRYAHSRGILHLDFKPGNVMVGPFGEVYILDWGLAMSLEEDAEGRFPLARLNDRVVGTPCYIAPDLLTQDGTQLSIRTDVYLLGAVLFEIVAGRPPHRGESIFEMFYSSAVGLPQLPDDAPAELASICRKAMAVAPEDRYADCEELRLALRDFLAHRGSTALAAEAARQLDALEATLRGDPDDEAEAGIHRLFNEARFGFRQALSSWPDNPDARTGLRRVLTVMVEHELDRGRARTARNLLSELDEPPTELVERVEAALRARAGEAERVRLLERLGADIDLSIGRRGRTVVLALGGLTWAMPPLLRALRGTEQSYLTMAVRPVVFAAVTGLLAWLTRRSWLATRINRRILAVLIFALASQSTFAITASALALPIATGETLLFLLWFVIGGLGTLLADRRLVTLPLIYLVGLYAALTWPEQRAWAMGGSHLALIVAITVAWWPKREGVDTGLPWRPGSG